MKVMHSEETSSWREAMTGPEAKRLAKKLAAFADWADSKSKGGKG